MWKSWKRINIKFIENNKLIKQGVNRLIKSRLEKLNKLTHK